MPTMRPTVDIAKIQIPTGYEQLQREAASKRRIADAMLGQGLGARQNMNSWAQLFGQLGSAYFGKRADKKATELEGQMQSRLRQDYTDARGGLLADVQAGMAPDKLVEKYGANPLLKDDLAPYADAMATILREREKRINFGGRAGVRQGDVEGLYENDPNKPVHVDPSTGMMQLNPMALQAAAVTSGARVPDEFPATAALPGFQPQSQQPNQQVSVIPPEIWQNDVKSLGMEGAIRFAVSKGLAVPITGDADFALLPSGAAFVGPDGIPRRKP